MLLRAPEGWPQPVVATVAMVLLAVLDLAGSLAAKEAVERRSVALALTGAGFFLLVFWVYISSLKVAELSAVTFGWVVILQVGVVLLDRFRYGVMLAPGTWLAIAILLAAQAYLILAPTAEPIALESAQRADQLGQAAPQVIVELGDAERAESDAADQQGLADGLVPRVVHLPPQREAAPSAAVTGSE
jgi:hypothetical protein